MVTSLNLLPCYKSKNYLIFALDVSTERMVIDMIGLFASMHLGIRAERGPLGADNALRRVRLQTPDEMQQPMRERKAVGLQTRKT
jgi:hypothetical protein